MDRLSFDAAHAALGNDAGQTGIEISLGGLMLNCQEGAVTLAVTGGDFAVEHAGHKTGSWVVLTLQKGERLSIRAGGSGSWAYVVFAGELQAPTWLDSAATHSTSGFGGGQIAAPQILTVNDATVREDRLGDIPKPDFAQNGPIQVVMGPQDQHFQTQAKESLLADTFQVTDAYDRMGMRLGGAALELDGALSIPSEPIVRGSIQVSGDGVPTVLLADHQTTGGYPKIATVISPDIDRLVQHRSGQNLKFRAVTAQDAIIASRAYAKQKSDYLLAISTPRGSLLQRLMRENLIHGDFEY
jgi:allophanate hydrolase